MTLDYKEGTMKLVHPETLKIWDREKSLEKGSSKTILSYHYLPQKEKT